MSLQHSVERGMSLGKDVVWVTVWAGRGGGLWCVFVPWCLRSIVGVSWRLAGCRAAALIVLGQG